MDIRYEDSPATIKLQCPDDLSRSSDQEIIGRFTELLFETPEKYVCYTEELWNRRLINDDAFFMSSTLALDLYYKDTDHLKIRILLQADRPEKKDSFYKKPAFLDLAGIYADKKSNFHNPQEARRYYIKSYLSEFQYLHRPESCHHHFSSNIPKSMIENDIHRATISDLQSFCKMHPAELFKIAEKLETGIKPYFQDTEIAFAIYNHIGFQLAASTDPVNPEISELEKAVRQKIQNLENNQHP